MWWWQYRRQQRSAKKPNWIQQQTIETKQLFANAHTFHRCLSGFSGDDDRQFVVAVTMARLSIKLTLSCIYEHDNDDDDGHNTQQTIKQTNEQTNKEIPKIPTWRHIN